LSLWRNAIVALFVAAILGGILLPVYTDEIGWRLQERAGFDGLDKLYVEICGPNTLVRPPFFMMPARWYSALFNGAFADPFYVRISGILYALAWLAMALALFRRIAPDRIVRDRIAILGVGLMSLGAMPLLLVWSRPEQPLLLTLTAALLFATSAWRAPESETGKVAAWLRSLAILALGAIALSYHIKALFLLPLFLVCIFFASTGRRSHAPRLIAATLLAAATAAAAFYWIGRLGCPGDTSQQAMFVRNNMGAVLVGTSGWEQKLAMVGKLFGNISLVPYFGLPTPRPEPMSFWMPGGLIGGEASFAIFLVMVLAWSGAMLAGLFCLVPAAIRMARERLFDRNAVLAAALLAAAMGWSATQGYRNDYEATFVLPILMFATVLSVASHRSGRLIGRYIEVICALVGVLAVVSPIALAVVYGPALQRTTATGGYVRGQPFSVGTFGYKELLPDIYGAAKQCGIRGARGHHALMLDDVTYFAFMESRLPQHQIGLDTMGSARTIAYLRGRKSDGLVVSCSGLPADLRARAKSQGAFCCLGPPDW
jgi:hypothetical protein